jgi:hypothetical protein
MKYLIVWLSILALLAGPAVAAGQTASEQVADFRLDRPPAMERVEKPLQEFAKAEGAQLTNQAGSGQPSLTLTINPATTIFILQPLPRGPLFFTLLMQPGHAAETPAQLALFERLKAKLRAEFPDLTIE